MATDADLLKDVKERFKDAEEADSEWRAQFKEDMRFRYGDQWNSEDLRQRQERGRPALTFNRINPTIRQITNDQRQNSPAPEVVPVDDKGDVKTAEVIQGMTRFTLNNSNSKSAFTTAFEHGATGGKGYFRILTEYASDETFDQDIKIKRIVNPASVAFDPNSTEIDGSDADHATITDEMSEEKYKRLFPKTELASLSSWSSDGNPFILNEKTVRIGEQFFSEYTRKKLLLLSDGRAILEDDLDRDLLAQQGLTVREDRERFVNARSIKWVKTNGVEILEKTDWPGLWIPIIPVYGEEYYLDGKIHRRGMVADARDPQRAFNALESAKIEAIALAPKAPWLLTAKQIENYKDLWDRSNENLPYLVYNSDANAGGPPQRNAVEPPIMAISQASMQSIDNIKAATGVFDAGLGAQSNETSGVAIARRTMQGQTANYHFQDHLNASLSHCGRQLVDLIPKIYDAQRAVRILGNEDEVQTVIVNSQDPNGDGLIYDLTAGKYDVRIQSGPSYLTKRQEAAASMSEASKTNPQIVGVAGDLMVKAMGWPHAQEIAERIRRTIPAHIVGDENGQPQLPPEIQAQMQQMQAMIQGLQGELEQAKNPIIAKQMELQSKERIETLKLETDVELKKMELEASVGGVDAALQTLHAQNQELNQRLTFLDQAFAQAMQPPQMPPPEMQADQSFQNQNLGFDQTAPLGAPSLQDEFPVDEFQTQFPTGGPSPGLIVEE